MGTGVGKHGKKEDQAYCEGNDHRTEPLDSAKYDEDLPAPSNAVLSEKELTQLSAALTINSKERVLDILNRGKLRFDWRSADDVYLLGLPCNDAMFRVMLESKPAAALTPQLLSLVLEDNLYSPSRLRMLLERGASPNARLRNSRKPPLSMAVRKQNLVLFRILLEFGANVNATDPQGLTPLHETVLLAHFLPVVPEIFELLLQNGADFTAKDRNNESPMELMTRLNVRACRHYLQKQKIP